MDTTSKFGWLYQDDLLLQRDYFDEMCDALGVKCIYKAPRADKEYDLHGDLDSKYYEPKLVGCIFDEYPNQKTLKKCGWVAELQEGASMIHVPFDLEHLQVGALFIVPSALDQAKGRVFRVIAMQTIMMYPASVACEIAPEYESITEPAELKDYSHSNFKLLVDNEEDD